MAAVYRVGDDLGQQGKKPRRSSPKGSFAEGVSGITNYYSSQIPQGLERRSGVRNHRLVTAGPAGTGVSLLPRSSANGLRRRSPPARMDPAVVQK